MSRSDRLARVQLTVATATAVGTVVVVLPPALDAYSLPKAAWLVAGAGLAVLLGLVRTVLRGRAAVPGPAPAAVIAGIIGVIAYGTVTSDAITLSVVGRLGRYSGAAVYLSALTLAIVHARRGGEDTVRRSAWAVLAVATVTALLAVAWKLGLDPTRLEARSLRQPATLLGNSNFTGAVAAFGVVLGAGAALIARSGRERAAAVVCAAACLAGVILSGALQAPFAMLGGLGIVVVGYLGSRDDVAGMVGAPVALGAGALGALLSVLGAFGRGPLSLVAGQNTFQLRIDSWKAAWGMFVANPLTGVGLDRYAAHYREYRPARSALTRSAEDFADAPHNVPLSMFSSGGIVLGAIYLATVVAVAVVAVRAWRRADPTERRLLGLAGGAWVAYHVQSLVSVDVPALVALHGLFAGMVLSAAGGIGFRERSLPWASLERSNSRDGRPGRQLRGGGPERTGAGSTSGAIVATYTLAALVTLVALVVLARPVRADIASYDAQTALDEGRPADAVPLAERAQDLAPWRTEYHVQEARAHIAADRLAPALDTLLDALERDPRDMDALVTAARVADRLERHELSIQLYRRMLVLEPQAPDLLREAADALSAQGHDQEAASILSRLEQLGEPADDR